MQNVPSCFGASEETAATLSRCRYEFYSELRSANTTVHNSFSLIGKLIAFCCRNNRSETVCWRAWQQDNLKTPLLSRKKLHNMDLFHRAADDNLKVNTSHGSTSDPLFKEAHATLIIGFWITGLLCIAGLLQRRYSFRFKQWHKIISPEISLPKACFFFVFVGMFSNVLAFMVLSRPTNCVMFHLLRSLACADFFFLVGIFLSQILINLFPVVGIMENVYLYNGYLIKYVSPVVLIFQTTSIWLTVVISIERYLAVCQPLLAHRICTVQKVNLGVILVFIMAASVNIPRFFERQVVRDSDNATFISTDVVRITDNNIYRYIYCSAVYFLFLFLIPMVIMALFTAKLIMKIRRANMDWENFTRRPRRSSMTHKNLIALRKNESTITRISLLIIVIFIVCGTPDLVVKTMVTIWNIKDNIWIVSMTAVSNMLLVLNSACNFVVYCLVGRKFRNALVQSIQCACVKEAAKETQNRAHMYALRSYSEMLPGEREEITLEEHHLAEITSDVVTHGTPCLVRCDSNEEIFEETALNSERN